MSTASLSERLDAFSRATGKAASWLTLAMVLITVVIVVLRYAFDAGMIWLQESLTWMHAVVFMMGAAWTLERDEHVRVDVFYRNMNDKQKAIVDVCGVVLFLLPFCAYMFYEGLEYVQRAWQIREISRDTGGLPYPAIPLLKTVLLLMPVTVALQGLAMLLRNFQPLARK